MSQITENTIIIKNEIEEMFLEKTKEIERITLDSVRCVFKNEEKCVYIFDSNGDAGDDLSNAGIKYLAIETNYLDGEEPWTRYFDEDGHEKDGDLLSEKTLTEYFSKKEIKKICKKIKYTDV